MEAVVFCGLQGSGKSTFYKELFFQTHLRLSMDLVKTRHREKLLFQTCLQTGQRLVIDNTNPTAEDRARYLEPARAAGFRLICFYFEARLEDCLRRNSLRPSSEQVPAVGIYSTFHRLQLPDFSEGFLEIYTVQLDEQTGFSVEPWTREA